MPISISDALFDNKHAYQNIRTEADIFASVDYEIYCKLSYEFIPVESWLIRHGIYSGHHLIPLLSEALPL
jgi:hypothetical protein